MSSNQQGKTVRVRATVTVTFYTDVDQDEAHLCDIVDGALTNAMMNDDFDLGDDGARLSVVTAEVVDE